MTNSIRVGCGEWGFRNRPLTEYFAIATSLGFHHLEFGIGGGWPGRLPERPTVAETAAFRRLVEKHQVSTRHCCLENDFTKADPAEHAAQLQKVFAQLPAAADCGAKIVRLFAGFTPVEEMTEALWGRLVSSLAECASFASKYDLTIAIETHGAITFQPGDAAIHHHTVTTHRDWLSRLVKELPPSIGINYDPGNLKAVDSTDRILAADILQGRITYCHLKDWRQNADGWVACAPGDDDLDYTSLLPIPDYDGVYLVEYEPLEDTVDGLKRSLTYLHRIIGHVEFR